MRTLNKFLVLVLESVYLLFGKPPKPVNSDDKKLGPDWKWKNEEIYSREPLSVLMFEKLHLKTVIRIGLAMILWGIFSLYVLPYLTGYLFPRQGTLASLEDWPSHIDAFILMPLVMPFFLIQPVTIKKILEELAHKGNIITTEKDYDSFIDWVVHSYNWKWWPIINLLIICITYIPWLLDFLDWPMRWWYYPNKWILIFVYTPYNMLQWYIGWTIIWRYIVTLVVLYTLFKQFPIHLSLYDARKAGGFSSIGDLIVSTSIFLCGSGLHLIVLSYALWNPEIPDATGSLLGVWVVYILIFISTLFFPLIITHRAMRKEKKRLENNLTIKSKEIMNKLDETLKQGEISKGSSDLINEIQTLGKQIEELPTSPLNISKLSKIILAIITPLVSGFYSKLVEKVSLSLLDQISVLLKDFIH